MTELVNTSLCNECSNKRYNCDSSVTECVCDNGECSCCKICKNIKSYPTKIGVGLQMDEEDVTYCSQCNMMLTHVFMDGREASFSLTKIHKKLNNEPVLFDKVFITTKTKTGLLLFCDNCAIGNVTNCGFQNCKICQHMLAIPMKEFNFTEYHKYYNMCFICKRFIDNQYMRNEITYNDFNMDDLHYVLKRGNYELCTVTSFSGDKQIQKTIIVPIVSVNRNRASNCQNIR